MVISTYKVPKVTKLTSTVSKTTTTKKDNILFMKPLLRWSSIIIPSNQFIHLVKLLLMELYYDHLKSYYPRIQK